MQPLPSRGRTARVSAKEKEIGETQSGFAGFVEEDRLPPRVTRFVPWKGTPTGTHSPPQLAALRFYLSDLSDLCGKKIYGWKWLGGWPVHLRKARAKLLGSA